MGGRFFATAGSTPIKGLRNAISIKSLPRDFPSIMKSNKAPAALPPVKAKPQPDTATTADTGKGASAQSASGKKAASTSAKTGAKGAIADSSSAQPTAPSGKSKTSAAVPTEKPAKPAKPVKDGATAKPDKTPAAKPEKTPAGKAEKATAAKAEKVPAAVKSAKDVELAGGGKPAKAVVEGEEPVGGAKPASAKPVAAKVAKKGAWFEVSTKTPKQSRFRMPAEWETHYGTFLTWPNKKGISFPGKGAYEAVLPAFESMLHALIASEQVFINVACAEDKQVIRDLLTIAEQSRLHFLDTPSMEPWCRDHGATFLVRGEDRAGGSVLWKFNAWGQKYDKASVDAGIGRSMAEFLGGKIFEPGMVLEGGAIEVNGSGTVLTTESCLLNKNRNKGVKKEDMDRLLKDFLGVSNVLWLPGGLEGDDTDGHIDTLTRFVNKNTVVTCVEENPKDKNHAVLKKNLELLKGMKIEDGTDLQVVNLPMPQPILRKGQRLPATYANFYVGNKVVLLPTYDDPADEKALEIMVKSFPTRRIYPIDCRELIWGLGTFHCLTQQIPLAAFPKVVDLIRNPPPAPRPVY
jgi:agmatine deiminase